MNSALYHGHIQHRRLHPKQHAFRYSIGMLWLDLSEQEQLFATSRFVGKSRFAPFSFRETDYLPHLTRKGVSLFDAVRASISELGELNICRICVLTQPRSWGLSFNPVSFFYCYDDAAQLQAILCEVSNTPWRERYHYVLKAELTESNQFAVAKSFHVSPFLPRDIVHHMRFYQSGDRLTVYMSDFQDTRKVFDAGLSLFKTELTRQSLKNYVLKYPWMSAKTLAGIYWQALRLVIKGLRYQPYQPADGNSKVAYPINKERP